MEHKVKKENLINTLIELDSYKKAILTDFNSLNLNQLHFKPRKNEWSLIQVAEHLVLTEMASSNYISKKLLDISLLKGDSPLTKLRFALLNIAMKSPFKFNVPGKSKIVPSERPKLSDLELKWNIARNTMGQIIENNSAEVLDKLLWKHPIAGRFNFNEMLNFCLSHLKRHFKQMKEIKNHPSFPETKKVQKYEELLQLDKINMPAKQK